MFKIYFRHKVHDSPYWQFRICTHGIQEATLESVVIVIRDGYGTKADAGPHAELEFAEIGLCRQLPNAAQKQRKNKCYLFHNRLLFGKLSAIKPVGLPQVVILIHAVADK